MEKHLKVPFRSVYAFGLREWLKATFWCHVVIRVFPYVADLGSDALLELYLEDPKEFLEQYRTLITKAVEARKEWTDTDEVAA